MKNKVLALVTGLSSLVLLAACSNQQNGLTSTTSSSSVEQSQSSSSESSSQEKKVDTFAYDSIISKYQTAVANNQTDASLNSLVVTYANSQTSPASTVYTYRDLDGNGVDELILAFKPGKLFKEHMITDIYTISKDSGQVIRLTEGPQLGMLGERMTLAYLKDNTFSYYGSAGAMAGGGSGYHFSSDSGADKADLSNWDWKDLSSASTNSSSSAASQTQTSSTSLKPDELKNGNYKSAVGTWKSSNGKTITITSDGQLDFWGYTYPIDKVSSNQYVSGIYSLTYVDSNPTGNTPIRLCPKGISGGSDAGDNSKERILATNGMPSEEDYYYRVD